MKKLLLTGCAALALSTAAHADQMDTILKGRPVFAMPLSQSELEPGCQHLVDTVAKVAPTMYRAANSIKQIFAQHPSQNPAIINDQRKELAKEAADIDIWLWEIHNTAKSVCRDISKYEQAVQVITDRYNPPGE